MGCNNIEFYVNMDITLKDLKDLLEKLRLDDTLCYIGGDDGAIQYDYIGCISVLDVDDADKEKILKIILENPYVSEGYGLTINGEPYDVASLRFAYGIGDDE